MTIAEALLPEFDVEMATTRRLLERVPTDKGEWKPHEKSFPLGHLSQLVATMPGWIRDTLHKDDINLASGSTAYSFQKTDSLVEQFDKHVGEARGAITDSSDEALQHPWSLKHGEQVLMTLPRGAAIRQHLNHLIHHRGQLSVYLRLVDVPLPSIYGPTADEPWNFAG
ncbi:MAG: damage-inducible protein DinB [Gemmatimonadota bacterium]|nr:damage-inducible protein DinB [Gemmatimonadota bacterium]